MTSSNVLSLPFRRSTQLSLSTTIRQYISKKYDQHPDMFKHDLEVIDQLRRDAVDVREVHSSGIKKLQKYAGQLAWIGGKFPIDIGAEFTWYPALGYNTERPSVQNNLKFELLNILYNLAALYSQLGVAANRGNTEGLKTAASWFSQAAGVLTHMKTTVLPELRMPSPPEDMDETTLESLAQLMLAQSQECFWQKAVMDGYKDASIAKLAARVSDLYNNAGEAAMRSEAISSAWIHHVSAKHHHFAAAAQYRAACDCLEKRKYGEEVARLKDAVACVNEGIKEGRGGYLSKAVLDDLNGLKQRVEEDLKRAEKDNDLIYLNIVPPKSELRTLERANMAVARIPPEVSSPYDFMGDHAEFGPALFTKLVPFSVHVAVSIYEERRDRLVNSNIIQELEVITEKLHEILSSLNLPGSLQALEKPMGLPGTLSQHAEEIRQADAISRLERSFADIDKLRTSDRAIFEEGRALLLAEEEEDSQLRRKHGTQRWGRPEGKADTSPNGGARLWSQATEIDGYLASSTSSDAVVRDKYAAVEEALAVLAGPDRALLDFVPSSRRAEIPESVKPALGRLRSAYNDVLRLESRRRKRVEALREKARADDIKTDILKEAARLEREYPSTAIVPAHFEEFFEKRLDSVYEADVAGVQREAEEQEKALAEVTRLNREFEAAKRSAGGQAGAREREAVLQRLDSAFYKYKEIVSNLEAGRKFYNDLARLVGQFRDQVRAWVSERRREARALEEEIAMPPLSALSINHPQSPPIGAPGSAIPLRHAAQSPGRTQSPNSYFTSALASSQLLPPQPQVQQPIVMHSPLAQAHIQSWADGASSLPPPQQPNPVAPVAPMGQGTWTPNAGIKFAPSPSPAGAGSVDDGHAASRGQPEAPRGGRWNPGSGIRFG